MLLLWSLASRPAGATGGLRTVAISGMPSPGTNEAFGDVGYSGVSLNNRGETAFIASTSFNEYEFLFEPRPTTPINNESVWTEAGGSGLRLVAREGPGVPGDGTFAYLARPLVSDLGHTIYQGSFAGQDRTTQDNATNILRNRPGQTDVVVAAFGAIAPSTSVTYYRVDSPSINANGDVAFFGGAYYPIYTGVWAELGGGPLEMVARQDTSAPGTAGVFRELGRFPYYKSGLAIGLGGHVVFQGVFRSDRLREGIWLAHPAGDLQAVVRAGDPAPGVHAIFNNIGPPDVNGQGDLAFSSGLTPPPFPQGSNDGGKALWRYSADTGAVLAALQGHQAPGVDAIFASNHVNFPTFRDPILGEGGHMAFGASLLHNNVMTQSIWLADRSNTLRMAAREGDPAPGTSDAFVSIGTPTVNARGQVAFIARTVDYSNLHYGIWAMDRNSVLRLIVKAGDLLDASDDLSTSDLRRVQYLSFSEGNSFGSEGVTGFNDLGQVAFFARFTDGTSGVFVSNAVAVPEPSTVLTFAPLALVWGLRNWRRGRF